MDIETETTRLKEAFHSFREDSGLRPNHMYYETNSFHKPSHDPVVRVSMVGQANFSNEVLLADKTVLLLCMPRNESFSKQVDVINFVSSKYEDNVKACLVTEEFIDQFCQEYDVKGTPTFLLFSGGVEIDRILGCIDRETVSKYLARHLPS